MKRQTLGFIALAVLAIALLVNLLTRFERRGSVAPAPAAATPPEFDPAVLPKIVITEGEVFVLYGSRPDFTERGPAPHPEGPMEPPDWYYRDRLAAH